MTASTPFSTPLISTTALLARLNAGQACVLLDCRFDLADTQAGRRAFDQGHLPGAIYAHLDEDLSGPKTPRGPLEGGRHPLPTAATLAVSVGRWGIAPHTPVVTYDAQGGPYAARAWWLLRSLGHVQVTVLDGGLQAWLAAGGGLTADASPNPMAAGDYPAAHPSPMRVVSAQDLLSEPGLYRVLDARAAERFRGDVEPLDNQAGHIPGALNRFFKNNLDDQGRFLSPEALRDAFAALGGRPSQWVHQCGSGVTACHNLLAMEVAGLHGSALYPGSWSEWSADLSRPIAKG